MKLLAHLGAGASLRNEVFAASKPTGTKYVGLTGLSAGAIVEWTSYHSLSHWAVVLALGLVAAAIVPMLEWRRRRPALATSR